MGSVPLISYWPRLQRVFFIYLFLSVFITHPGLAQRQDYGWKLSPLLAKQISVTGEVKLKFRVTVSGLYLPWELSKPKFGTKTINADNNFTFIIITCTAADLFSEVLPLSNVIFAEDATRIPKEELLLNNLDLSVNEINRVHRVFPQWNGEGIMVSIKENKPDTADIDFAGRFLTTQLASNTVTSHASIMTTMIAGAGNSWHLGKGAAWGSTISSSSFATLLPDANSAYQQYNITLQNHSYGVGIENYYGADAAAYDASSISNPYLLHVFSSGNSGALASTTGTYSGLPGFANLTGSFKMAKNILTVGATDSFSVVAALSSKGPAHDGRVRPELIAFGEDGSSGAAALVSGTALILQQVYKELNSVLPPNALVKTILINSADDKGNAEVDYSNGFGSLNSYQAIKTLVNGRYFTGSVMHAGTEIFTVSVPPGIKKVKLTLVWNDPPAAPNAGKALVNDLDLELFHPSSGQSWQPWVLNKFPHVDSLQQLAVRKKDSLNNVEQITLENPVAGNYQFKITGFNITTASQSFYIAYQFDSTDVFEWQFPTANDFIFSASSNAIRWKSSFAAVSGKLEYSIDAGNNWVIIDNTANLTDNFYRWNTPSIISKAILRMTIGLESFVSDTFTISRRTITGVGFNCPDSFLIFWNKIPGITDYRLYRLGNKYLEELLVTADSFVVLAKNSNPSLYYAVAPMIGNREGVKSYTINYTIQGVECYIRSFLASQDNNSANLDLLLGTLYGINRIILEKFDGTGFVQLQQLLNPGNLLLSFTDTQLKKGLNIYRAKLELGSGGIVYSQPVTVYYFPGVEFIVYPNPVSQNQAINILSSNTVQDVQLEVVNALGQKVYERVIDDVSQQIPAGRLSKGLYFFRFVRKGEKDVILKVIVL